MGACLYLFCYALLCVYSSFAIILKRKRKLVALLLLSYICIVTINVLWLFLKVPWVVLQCVVAYSLTFGYIQVQKNVIVVVLSMTCTPTVLLAIKCTVIDFSSLGSSTPLLGSSSILQSSVSSPTG